MVHAARPRHRSRAVLLVALGPLLALLLGACSQAPLARPTAADKVTPPRLGACYDLAPADVRQPTTETAAVDCTQRHTAQTFAIGQLPRSTGTTRQDPAHGRWIYPRCQAAYQRYVGIDDSLALRVRLSWAWFRPSQKGWEAGARWYRCDLLGGPSGATSYRPLPKDGKGMLTDLTDAWLACARGTTVAGSTKVPCTQRHDWRAVTTIKLGEDADPWPGDRLALVRTRDYCSDSVGAWMNYPVEYDYGYTVFHEDEWKAGNRRSVCWAKTDQ